MVNSLDIEKTQGYLILDYLPKLVLEVILIFEILLNLLIFLLNFCLD